jgi:hypothetical protein
MAYVDFGSACNIMRLNKAISLKLPINTAEKTTLVGFGGGVVTSIGGTRADIKVDEVERAVPIVVVNNETQEVDLLIGQPFTELTDVLTIKTGDTLKFHNNTDI